MAGAILWSLAFLAWTVSTGVKHFGLPGAILFPVIFFGAIMYWVTRGERKDWKVWIQFPTAEEYMRQNRMGVQNRIRCNQCGSTFIQDQPCGEAVIRQWPWFWRMTFCRLHWCGTCNTPLYRTTI